MTSRSVPFKSRPRRQKIMLTRIRQIMQRFFVFGTLVISIRHLIPGSSSRAGSFDAFCPFGGVENLWHYLTTGTPLETTNLLNFTMLMAVVAVSLVGGRAFCGWMCPLGTIQDMLAGWFARVTARNQPAAPGKKSQSRFPVTLPPSIDHRLRLLKYGVLAAILVASAAAVYPPLHYFCPARAVFSFKLNTPLLWFTLVVFVSTSLLVKRFWCKYLCPLGALLASFNKISLLRPVVNPHRCVACGRCDNTCLMDIPNVPENIRSAECIRCLECMETCARPDTITLRLG